MNNFLTLLLETACVGLGLALIAIISKRHEKSSAWGGMLLIVWNAVATVLAEFQVGGVFEVFGLTCAGGNVWFASSYMAVAVLADLYDQKTADCGVLSGGMGILIFLLFSAVTRLFSWSGAGTDLLSVCNTSVRIGACSILMYCLSIFVNSRLVTLSRKAGRNSTAALTVISAGCNIAENIGFSFLAFTGVLKAGEIWEIIFVASIIEGAIGLLNAPFIRLIKWGAGKTAAHSPVEG